MFFGLTNSPVTFQTMMNTIFYDLIADGSMTVYMDNMAIHTVKWAEETNTVSILQCSPIQFTKTDQSDCRK